MHVPYSDFGHKSDHIQAMCDSVLSCCRPQHAVTVTSPSTGIVLEVDTTSPGLQFYSGGLLSTDAPVVGKAGVEYPRFGGFAVETQVT